MTPDRDQPSESELKQLLPLAYLLRAKPPERPWPGEPPVPATRRQLPTPAALLMVAGSALLVILLIWLIVADVRPTFQPQVMTRLLPTTAAPAAEGVVLRDADRLLAFVQGLPEPASGFRYVLWHENETGVRALGHFGVRREGSAALRVSETPRGGTFRVTLEERVSHERPNGPVILRADHP
ncbi:MAG: anti-sigma factor [Spirochaetales bacterium]